MSAPDPSSTAASQLFDQAVAALRAGDAGAARRTLDRLPPSLGAHPAVLQLEAGLARANGDYAAAIAFLDRALAHPDVARDPSTLMNRAMAAERVGRLGEARAFAARAAELPGATWPIIEARIALTLRLDGREATAALFEGLLAATGRDPFVVHQYALHAFATDRLALAATLADELLERAPSPAAQLLRASIAERAGEPAKRWFKGLAIEASGDREAAKTRASALLHEDGAAAALDYLEARLDQWPDWSDGRDVLAKIAWQAGMGERAEQSFQRREREAPDDEANSAAYLHFLANTAGPTTAWHAAERRLAGPGANADRLRLLAASLASEAGDLDAADRLFAETAAPVDDPAGAIAATRHAIRAGRLDAALGIVEPWATERQSGEAWAYVWSLWRALGDSRLGWLEQDGRLWGTQLLDGFDDLQPRLAPYLRALHGRFRTHPYEQSPRGGTQTDGPLFALPDAEIVALRAMVERALRRFIDALPPHDPAHPVLSRPRHHIAFAGSWSIRLSGAGFHRPHYHSQGWLSSALYVTVPNEVGDEGHAGWLTLGVPPADLGLPLPPLDAIRPREGLLALFPSILWHGTEPFTAGERMTVAFDTIPLPY